jgi:hypothetical protein
MNWKMILPTLDNHIYGLHFVTQRGQYTAFVEKSRINNRYYVRIMNLRGRTIYNAHYDTLYTPEVEPKRAVDRAEQELSRLMERVAL